MHHGTEREIRGEAGLGKRVWRTLGPEKDCGCGDRVLTRGGRGGLNLVKCHKGRKMLK